MDPLAGESSEASILMFPLKASRDPRPLAGWLYSSNPAQLFSGGLEGSLAFGWKGNVQGLLQAFELKIPMDREEVAPEGFRASSPVKAAFAPLPGTGPAARGDTTLPSRALGQAARHSGLQVLAAALLWRQYPGALPRGRRKCRLKPKAVSRSRLQLARARGEQLGSIWGSSV